MSEKQPTLSMEGIVKIFVENLGLHKYDRDETLELEAKFATMGFRKISHIDYNNIIKKLLSSGFTIGPKQEKLRIFNELIDVQTGKTGLSNIRTEIGGMGNVSKYCKTNEIAQDMDPIFEQKTLLLNKDGKVYPVNVPDFNFRVSLQKEKRFSESAPIIRSILESWNDNKKTFRYISRNTLIHEQLPVKVDVSIVKNSKSHGRVHIPERNFIDSETLDSMDHYEVEIEIDNQKVLDMIQTLTQESPKLPAKTLPGGIYEVVSQGLLSSLRKVIKYVLIGLQETNYPVSYVEQNNVLQEYMRMLWLDKYRANMRVLPKNFIGPSQYTLQVQNIMPIDENVNVPNIRNNYTVTEKADGQRKLLFIDNKGRIYLLTTNMNIQFTGAVTKLKTIYNTLLDGEHILHNKKQEYINLYAAFDIYYKNKDDVRALPFTRMDETSPENRLQWLNSVISNLKPVSIISGKPSPITIVAKKFYKGDASVSIFAGCNTILQKEEMGGFDYETDGLIFTPSETGVGTDVVGKTTKLPLKMTWAYSFKWKPVEFNTIDFLVTIQKGTDGHDYIGNIFQDGINTSKSAQITQYKVAELRVGFDEEKHGYINPCQNLVNGDLPVVQERDRSNTYKPMRFYPTNPSDPNAGLCNLLLYDGPSNNKIMKTLENELIEDNMIVEFRYDLDRDERWRWIPLRVRYDKTADLRNNGRNFGNAYHVANSNWHTIHNPITKEMITKGIRIPESIVDEQVYYNVKTGDSLTKGLREFHNMFVKKGLIKNTTKPGDILIDLAVGKGGDLPKWIAAKLRFVFGIDISRDSIQNRNDGACARYLNFRKKYSRMPSALFVHGTSSINIRNTDGIYSDKGKQITKAVFGEGAKDVKALGKGVYDVYGIGKDGFDVCSIQFAIHYMFENQHTLQNLLRNVSETTKLGGYFIGTSYDGKTIFDMLAEKQQGEAEDVYIKNKKIWSVTKEYNRDEFADNESSLGYAINVYQESINKSFREYLVNYDYLTRMLENYGFVPISGEEARQLQLPSGIGSFRSMYGRLEQDAKRNSRLKQDFKQALNMSENEKKISFLNKYFVYKKIRHVDAENIARNLLGETIAEEKEAQEESKEAQEESKEALEESKEALEESKKESKEALEATTQAFVQQEQPQQVLAPMTITKKATNKGIRKGMKKKKLKIDE